STTLLERSYQQWADDNRIARRSSRVQIGIRLTKIYGQGQRANGSEIIGEVDALPFGVTDPIVKQYRPHGYYLRALEDARARFTDARGVSGDPWRAEQ